MRYSRYRHRRRLPGASMRTKKMIATGALLVLLSGAIFGLVKLMPQKTMITGLSSLILGQHGNKAIDIMYRAMPVLEGVVPASENALPVRLTDSLVYQFCRVFRMDRQNPLALLEQELPMLARHEVLSAPVMQPQPQVKEKQKAVVPALSQDCLVGIYNTHTGETYALTDGVERLQGKKGGVVQAAAALEKVLEKKFGIRVARSEVIHDEVYNESYMKSQRTLEKMLDENPALLAVLDVHRDAEIPRKDSIVQVNGETVAPVLIIVGSDARAAFPGWQNNYQFAQDLADGLNKKHPGLCKKVRVYDGRYNQHMHSRALLLEIGSVTNSTPEAVRTAEILGEVLGPMILELKKQEREV